VAILNTINIGNRFRRPFGLQSSMKKQISNFHNFCKVMFLNVSAVATIDIYIAMVPSHMIQPSTVHLQYTSPQTFTRFPRWFYRLTMRLWQIPTVQLWRTPNVHGDPTATLTSLSPVRWSASCSARSRCGRAGRQMRPNDKG
jgi:hypothetical protein